MEELGKDIEEGAALLLVVRLELILNGSLGVPPLGVLSDDASDDFLTGFLNGGRELLFVIPGNALKSTILTT